MALWKRANTVLSRFDVETDGERLVRLAADGWVIKRSLQGLVVVEPAAPPLRPTSVASIPSPVAPEDGEDPPDPDPAPEVSLPPLAPPIVPPPVPRTKARATTGLAAARIDRAKKGVAFYKSPRKPKSMLRSIQRRAKTHTCPVCRSPLHGLHVVHSGRPGSPDADIVDLRGKFQSVLTHVRQMTLEGEVQVRRSTLKGGTVVGALTPSEERHARDLGILGEDDE
jgi:hypothetical protein